MQNQHDCDPWDGRASRYQNECIRRLWVERATEIQPWEWVSTSCATPYCVAIEHLEVHSPRKLAYPAHQCVYCGRPGYTRDHLVPQPWSGLSGRRYVLMVDACGQCNSLINDHPEATIPGRRRVAQQRIARKYRKTLAYREYTEDELNEFGPALRGAIREGLAEKRAIEARLRFPEDPVHDFRYLEKSGYEDPHSSGLI